MGGWGGVGWGGVGWGGVGWGGVGWGGVWRGGVRGGWGVMFRVYGLRFRVGTEPTRVS